MALASKPEIEDCETRWTNRILRAGELREIHPANAAAMRFYEAVLQFQFGIARISASPAHANVPLRDQIDLKFVSSQMPALLALCVKFGPTALGTESRKLQEAGKAKWQELLESAISVSNSPESLTNDFFARACLQPIAESLQAQFQSATESIQSTCPPCGGLPQTAVLRPEGEGASRWLQCSFCLCEWPFRRLACPWCGEENKEKLPRYSSEHYSYVHVEACDTCKRYLKAVDLTVDGRAVPLVDEAALAVLDVWAVDSGYAKIIQNILGF